MSEIISSPEEFKRFMEGSIYGDYLKELNIREAYVESLLKDIDLQYNGRDYDKMRGCLKDINDMRGIFIDLMENKANDLEEVSDDS